MEDFVKIFKSPEGDVYHITLSEDSRVLSENLRETPQEYRSRLFEKMFHRYVRLHHIEDVRLSVVEVNGINEKYFFHVIYRECHSMLASLIGSDIQEGLGK